MLEESEYPWSYVIGGKTIKDAVEKAIEAGAVLRRADGRLELRSTDEDAEGSVRSTPQVVHHPKKFTRSCRFLNQFLFGHVYSEATVPFGCRSCYKVKIVSPSLRHLMAVKNIAETIPFTSKSGPEIDNSDNPHPYGTYVYVDGLGQARAVYKQLRVRLDEDPLLGSTTEMYIKRGCTNYEIKCGPSDRFEFDPTLEKVEAALRDLFVNPAPARGARFLDGLRMLQMVQIAYRMGDETYRDFTGGRSLAPAVVRYSPEDPET